MRIAILAILLVLGSTAHADCSVKPVKVEALGDTVGIFDKDGKFVSEMPKSALGPGLSVLDCNEDLGLVQVTLGGEPKWLDRGELKLTFADGAAPTKVCVVAASTRASDHTEAAVAGVDPDEGKACVPPKP